MGGQRFAVLLCAEESKYVKDRFGGYFGVFKRLLAEQGETWDLYRVVHGHFPKEDEIREYHGFVITGSCNDAHGNDPWIQDLLNLIKKLDSMKKKLLGICFGCQILARALGGKIGRRSTGWDIGVTAIRFSKSSSSSSSSYLSIIECHRDEVLELPDKAQVIGRSNKTGIEAFKYGDHMMGIQGHPEYDKAILLHLVDRLLQRDYIDESFVIKVKNSMDDNEPHREAWRQLCITFLKGTLRHPARVRLV